MTSPRKETNISNLRPESHDTYGCVPVRSSVARDHEAVDGDTAKVTDVKSSLNMGEANVTASASKDVGARNRRSPVQKSKRIVCTLLEAALPPHA